MSSRAEWSDNENMQFFGLLGATNLFTLITIHVFLKTISLLVNNEMLQNLDSNKGLYART